MKNVKTLLSFFFLLVFATTNGQTKPDFIEMRSKGYFYKNQKTNRSALGKILRTDKQAHAYHKKYKVNRNIGRAMSSLGLIISTHKLLAFSQSSSEGSTQEIGPKLLYFKFSGLTFILLGSTFHGFGVNRFKKSVDIYNNCLLYTSPSPRDATLSRMPSSA